MNEYTKPTVEEGQEATIVSMPHQTRCSGRNRMQAVKF